VPFQGNAMRGAGAGDHGPFLHSHLCGLSSLAVRRHLRLLRSQQTWWRRTPRTTCGRSGSRWFRRGEQAGGAGPGQFPGTGRNPGWGQMITTAVGPGAVIANYADSGESSGSFLHNSALFPALASKVRANDAVFIQLGHNDKQTSAAAYLEQPHLHDHASPRQGRHPGPGHPAGPPTLTRLTSPGTSRPASRRARSTPRAMWSLAAKTAVTPGRAASCRPCS
jgi:hypothetical protein